MWYGCGTFGYIGDSDGADFMVGVVRCCCCCVVVVDGDVVGGVVVVADIYPDCG